MELEKIINPLTLLKDDLCFMKVITNDVDFMELICTGIVEHQNQLKDLDLLNVSIYFLLENKTSCLKGIHDSHLYLFSSSSIKQIGEHRLYIDVNGDRLGFGTRHLIDSFKNNMDLFYLKKTMSSILNPLDHEHIEIINYLSKRGIDIEFNILPEFIEENYEIIKSIFQKINSIKDNETFFEKLRSLFLSEKKNIVEKANQNCLHYYIYAVCIEGTFGNFLTKTEKTKYFETFKNSLSPKNKNYNEGLCFYTIQLSKFEISELFHFLFLNKNWQKTLEDSKPSQPSELYFEDVLFSSSFMEKIDGADMIDLLYKFSLTIPTQSKYTDLKNSKNSRLLIKERYGFDPFKKFPIDILEKAIAERNHPFEISVSSLIDTETLLLICSDFKDLYTFGYSESIIWESHSLDFFKDYFKNYTEDYKISSSDYDYLLLKYTK